MITRLRRALSPIRRMVSIERRGGLVDRSVAADNTAAFNWRPTIGSTNWSRYAYGVAIHVNPIENPCGIGGRTKWCRRLTCLERIHVRRGMTVEGGILVRAFDAVGWERGGRWRSGRRPGLVRS